VAANGYIPSSWLKPLPGSNAGLIKGYAYAYWRWHYESLRRGGPPLTIIDGSVGRTYRSFVRQVLAKQIFGSNAATPGTSNHGLGKAVDLMTQAQRRASDLWGAPYGWLKAWSDAWWEWWHLRGVKTMSPIAKPDPIKKLPVHMRGACYRLLYHRRLRIKEARSGRGPRWRRQNRYVEFWYKRVQGFHRRAKNSQYKQILGRVLNDRNGRL
jgi:hypothetical protein